jgi:hypothetical protein
MSESTLSREHGLIQIQDWWVRPMSIDNSQGVGVNHAQFEATSEEVTPAVRPKETRCWSYHYYRQSTLREK